MKKKRKGGTLSVQDFPSSLYETFHLLLLLSFNFILFFFIQLTGCNSKKIKKMERWVSKTFHLQYMRLSIFNI
jgi:hypothetical protein